MSFVSGEWCLFQTVFEGWLDARGLARYDKTLASHVATFTGFVLFGNLTFWQYSMCGFCAGCENTL